jgi:hypothetical protein
MQFDGALIREQGVPFAVVAVKPHVVQNRMEAGRAAAGFQPAFPGVPIVLMAQDGHGVPTHLGRRDLVNFLSSVPMRAIRWKRYTLN